MLAIYSAYQRREAEVRDIALEYGLDKKTARDTVTGIFPRVWGMVRKFICRVSDGRSNQPGPIDQILETRIYGIYIRFNITASGYIDQNKDQLQFKRTRLGIGQLADIIYTLVDEARVLLGELAMVGEDSKSGTGPLLTIPQGRVEDDNSDKYVGYSFLRDSRNSQLEEGKYQVLNRIAESDKLQRTWLYTDRTQTLLYNIKAIRLYGIQVERFREKLQLSIYITSSQLARAIEILGIRFRNTANSSARNVFISKGQVYFVTAYYKNFLRIRQAKIIHRFIPIVVGELLVQYLQLVLPFWQQVQGIVKGADRPSAFLQGDEITSAGDTSGQLGDLDGEDIDVATEQNDSLAERRQTPDRARRIIQQHGERLIGYRLNISTQRHVAIAISNRFLGTKHPLGGGEDGGHEDKDGIDNEVSDLQAGHGMHVAGILYARELQ